MKRFFDRAVLVAVLAGAVALGLRLPGLGSFMTVDEENWIIRSSHYYRKLFEDKDTGGAFMTTHPGATAMWIAGAGIAMQEARLGFDADTSNLIYFRRAAVLPVALTVSMLVGAAAYVLVQLMGWRRGLLGGLFVATAPYFVGMSQVVHLDALLAMFMLISVLAFLVGWEKFDKRYLGLSAVSAGWAMATKMLPSLWLFVFMAVFLVWHYRFKVIPIVRRLGFVFGAAMLAFWITWPALWFTDDLNNSFEKDVPSVITDEHVALEVSEEPINPHSFYARTVLGRVTPFVLIISIAYVVVRIWHAAAHRRFELVATDWLIAYALGFLVLITFVAKKGDRYALPALVVFPLVAAVGFDIALKVMERWLKSAWWQMLCVGVISVLLIAQTLVWSPHAIAYNNPLFPDIRPFPQQGWGEGLELAAQWINSQPFDDRLHIASWYPSVMATYFEGRTMSLSSREDHRVGYVVLYRNMEGRAEDDIASNVLDEYKGREPEKIIEINGTPYAWIYNTLGPYYFRNNVGELVPGVEVGQIIPIHHDDWSRIDFALATYGRANIGQVRVSIYESADSTEPLRQAEVPVGNVPDQGWQAFNFDPIASSAGKTYYVSIEGVGSRPGSAITARYDADNLKPGQAYVIRDEGERGDRDEYTRTGDLGYRLVR